MTLQKSVRSDLVVFELSMLTFLFSSYSLEGFFVRVGFKSGGQSSVWILERAVDESVSLESVHAHVKSSKKWPKISMY